MRTLFFVIIILVVLVGGVATYMIRQNMEQEVYRDTFYEGIIVDDIPLGGMSYDQAKVELQRRNQPRLDIIRTTLAYQSRRWVFDYRDMNGSVDYMQQLDAAYEVGRTGGLIERYQTIMGLRQENMVFESTVSFDPELVRETISEIAEAFTVEATDASMYFDPDGEVFFPIQPETYGRRLDAGPVMAQVIANLQGRRFDDVIELQPEVVMPDVVAADFAGKTELVVQYSTDLASSTQNRRSNVLLSSQVFHGITIEPGQIVSFNEMTGPRGKANGYLDAPVIKADKSMEDEPGGGVCQSSTTIYNAIVMAGMNAVERSHHSFPSTYVATGLDATVNYPTSDFKFQNTRDIPMYMRTYIDNNKLFVEIYGEPIADGVTYKLRSEVYETMPIPPINYVQDTKGEFVTYTWESFKKVSGRKGIKVKTYRDAYQNNQLIGSELLANDFYKPIAPVVYVGMNPGVGAAGTAAR